MSYQVLYRKYRPQTFSEVLGQERIVATLQGALLQKRVGACVFIMWSSWYRQDDYRAACG